MLFPNEKFVLGADPPISMPLAGVLFIAIPFAGWVPKVVGCCAFPNMAPDAGAPALNPPPNMPLPFVCGCEAAGVGVWPKPKFPADPLANPVGALGAAGCEPKNC